MIFVGECLLPRTHKYVIELKPAICEAAANYQSKFMIYVEHNQINTSCNYFTIYKYTLREKVISDIWFKHILFQKKRDCQQAQSLRVAFQIFICYTKNSYLADLLYVQIISSQQCSVLICPGLYKRKYQDTCITCRCTYAPSLKSYMIIDLLICA